MLPGALVRSCAAPFSRSIVCGGRFSVNSVWHGGHGLAAVQCSPDQPARNGRRSLDADAELAGDAGVPQLLGVCASASAGVPPFCRACGCCGVCIMPGAAAGALATGTAG